ncbi:hypothetical protein AG1IA_03847 [Rhizoctonia solani AG-1 IA]|uniref:Uncharacterized protein n=1 Tax=Thanatephorus cucumeris (strain AG1-IA) TaxID=983506 RepID=L8X0H4_THACA|nr:hypothetical protein AG1IA_03847 [Rhizoctonia solani AG-1 IA]
MVEVLTSTVLTRPGSIPQVSQAIRRGLRGRPSASSPTARIFVHRGIRELGKKRWRLLPLTTCSCVPELPLLKRGCGR